MYKLNKRKKTFLGTKFSIKHKFDTLKLNTVIKKIKIKSNKQQM